MDDATVARCLVDGLCPSAIALAGQLGRLDLVSLLLAIMAIVLTLGGLFAFLNLRQIAKRVAEAEVKRIAKDVARQTAQSYIQSEADSLLEAAYRRSRAPSRADDIAKDGQD